MTTDTLEQNRKLTIAVDPIVLKSGTIVTQEEEERYFQRMDPVIRSGTARNEPYLIGQAGDLGVSGALHLQSAIAEPNASLGLARGRPRTVRNVDRKVLCNGLP